MKSVVFTFGRMNSPTYGHKKLIDKVISVAKTKGAEHRIYLSQSHDSTKNPLPYNKKVDFVRKLFPYANVVDDPKAKTAFHVCKILSDQGYKDVTLVVGDDRVDTFKREIQKYIKDPKDPSFDKNKHYAFDKFSVVSAGRRDANATGVEGASGTKMREFVKNGDISSFISATPTKNVTLARAIYNTVKKNLKENMQPNLDDFETEIINEDSMYDLETNCLVEGVNDPGIFKAVFLAGGPGSGKDFILHKIIKGTPLTEINSDIAFEILSKKEGVSLIMKGSVDRKRDEVRSRAKKITGSKYSLALMGRLGLIINGTGGDRAKISSMKKDLEQMGYETMMVFVNTTDAVSRERNIERGRHGGREVPEAIRKQKWDEAQENIHYYESLFGRNFYVVDNSNDLRYVSKETKKKIEAGFTKMHKAVRAFVAKKPTSKVAMDWIKSETSKRGITDFRPSKSGKFGSRNESLDENKALIDQMRKAYSGIDKIEPGSETYKRLVSILSNLDKKTLKLLASSDIKWVSALARNRLNKSSFMKEEIVIEKKTIFDLRKH